MAATTESEQCGPLEPELKEVRELSKLLAEQLLDGEEVEGFTSKPATALGDNYGSTMLALDITIRNKINKEERHLHTFCKMLPNNPLTREIFNVNVTFVKEMEMYTLAVPAMARLQRDCGVPEEDLVSNLVPSCYGARQSLSGGKVDDDAAILMEDMRQRRFTPGNRIAGLDLEHAKLVLEKVAVIQALAVALRRQRPQVYADTVMKACCEFHMGASDEGTFDDDSVTKFSQCILHNVKKSPEAAKHLDAIAKVCKEAKLGRNEYFPEIREPYASIFHNDMWTNNILVQRDDDGRPKAVALIDFQCVRINSPFKDVLFFILTSVDMKVTEGHFDQLIETYHASFCRSLEQVGVDTAPFSLSLAWEEINALARTELFHILFMLRWINADPDDIRANQDTYIFMEDLGRENYAKRVEHVVLQYAKRGWLSE